MPRNDWHFSPCCRPRSVSIPRLIPREQESCASSEEPRGTPSHAPGRLSDRSTFTLAPFALAIIKQSDRLGMRLPFSPSLLRRPTMQRCSIEDSCSMLLSTSVASRFVTCYTVSYRLQAAGRLSRAPCHVRLPGYINVDMTEI